MPSVSITSAAHWVDTGVVLEKGKTYRLVGALDRREKTEFLIGSECTYEATESGS